MERTSPHSPLSGKDSRTARYLASLSDAKVRKQERVYLIEGVKLVEEALRDEADVRQVIASPSLSRHHGRGVIGLAQERGIELIWISERLMDRIAGTKTPQPAMAVVGMREPSAEELLGHPARLVVLCHQLQDPGNLGTIIRTAEAAGASGVAVTARTVDPYNAKCIRASMGSILRMPAVRIAELNDFPEACRKAGFQIAALVLNGTRTHFDLDLRKPTVVMLGQEGSGLPEELLAEADLRVRIPMTERVDSLNVAASAAVVLYEAVRQRTSAAR